jgi:hypothetical protein
MGEDTLTGSLGIKERYLLIRACLALESETSLVDSSSLEF